MTQTFLEDIPEFLEIQRNSFLRILEKDLIIALEKINPISTASGSEYGLLFYPKDFLLVLPENTITEAFLEGKTYGCKIYVPAIIYETKIKHFSDLKTKLFRSTKKMSPLFLKSKKSLNTKTIKTAAESSNLVFKKSKDYKGYQFAKNLEQVTGEKVQDRFFSLAPKNWLKTDKFQNDSTNLRLKNFYFTRTSDQLFSFLRDWPFGSHFTLSKKNLVHNSKQNKTLSHLKIEEKISQANVTYESSIIKSQLNNRKSLSEISSHFLESINAFNRPNLQYFLKRQIKPCFYCYNLEKPQKSLINFSSNNNQNFTKVNRSSLEFRKNTKPLSKKEWVCIGTLPLMTPRGHFIINGSHRIVVSQMSRAPGLYYQTGDKLQATIVPTKGAWLRMSLKLTDTGEKKVWVRITPQRKMPYKVFSETYKFLEDLNRKNISYKNLKPSGLGQGIGQRLSPLSLNSRFTKGTGESLALKASETCFSVGKGLSQGHAKGRGLAKGAAYNPKGLNHGSYTSLWVSSSKFLNLTYKNINSKIKHFDKQYAIGVISGQINRTLLQSSSYTLGSLGRKRINERLGINQKTGYLTSKDISLIKTSLIKLANQDQSGFNDDIDHLENRRVRTCGELLQSEMEVGFSRLKKNVIKQLEECLNSNSTNGPKNIRLDPFNSSIKKQNPLNYSKIQGSFSSKGLANSQNLFLDSVNNSKPFTGLALEPFGLASACQKTSRAGLSRPLLKKNKPFSLAFLGGQCQQRISKPKFKGAIPWSSPRDNAHTAMAKTNGERSFGLNNLTFNLDTNLNSIKLKFLEQLYVKKQCSMIQGLFNLEFKNSLIVDEQQFYIKSLTGITNELKNQQLKNAIFAQKSKNMINDFSPAQTLGQTKPKLFLSESLKNKELNINSAPNFNREISGNNIWSPSKIVGAKAFTGALREFFGSNPLSQYMDQTNPLAEITHKRRLSSLGPGGVDRASAGIAIRGIHPSHYGRICPIETPEGKNAGLVNSMTMWTRVNSDGFLETPYLTVKGGSIMTHNNNISPQWRFVSTKNESSTKFTDNSISKASVLDLDNLKFHKHSFPLTPIKLESNSLSYVGLNSLAFSPSPEGFKDPNVKGFSNGLNHWACLSTPKPKPFAMLKQTLEALRTRTSQKGPLKEFQSKAYQKENLKKNSQELALWASYFKLAFESFGAPIGQELIPINFFEKDKVSQNTGNSMKIVASDLKISESSFLPNILLPYRDGSERSFERNKRNFMDLCAVSPMQNISVATSLIPFLEHDDATRALMGSNMQRQAVPLLKAQAPLVRTGLEGKVVGESGHALQANCSGLISRATKSFISIDSFNKKPLSLQLINLQVSPRKFSFLKELNPNLNLCKVSKLWSNGYLNKTKSKTYVDPIIIKSWTKLFFKKSKKKSKITSLLNFCLEEAKTEFSNPVFIKTNSSKKLVWRKNWTIDRQRQLLSLQGYTRSNQGTICVQRPAVQEGNWVQKGDLIGDCSASLKGVLALGQNIVVAYLPMEGFNFEDAIVVSDRLVHEELYTSIHIQRVEFDIDAVVKKHIPPKIKLKKQKSAIKTKEQDWITLENPHLLKSEKTALNSLGIIKIGSWVGPGDVLVSKVFPVERKMAPSRHLLSAVFQEKKTKTIDTDDTSLRVPKGIHGRVINVKIVGNGAIIPFNTSKEFSFKKFSSTIGMKPYGLVDHRASPSEKQNLELKTGNSSSKKTNQRLPFAFVRNIISANTTRFSRPNGYDYINSKSSDNYKKELINSINAFYDSYHSLSLNSIDLKLKSESLQNLRPFPKVFDALGLSQKSYSNSHFLNLKTFKGKNLKPVALRKPLKPFGMLKQALWTSSRSLLDRPWRTGNLKPSGLAQSLGFNLKPLNQKLLNNQFYCKVVIGPLNHKPWAEAWVKTRTSFLPFNSSPLLHNSVPNFTFVADNKIQNKESWIFGNFKENLGQSKFLFNLILNKKILGLGSKPIPVNPQAFWDKTSKGFIEGPWTNLLSSRFKIKNITNNQNLKDNLLFLHQDFQQSLSQKENLKGSIQGSSILPSNPAHFGQTSLIKDNSIDQFSKCKPLLGASRVKNSSGSTFQVNPKVRAQSTNLKNKEEYKIIQIRVYIAERKKLQVGDKMSGRHGNKGIVSTILPREDMPYLPDGTAVDMVLNPLGIPSRMNVGQVFECLLGLAASVCGETIGHTPFDEMYGPEASRSLVYLFLYVARLKTKEDWFFQPDFPGKTILFDGRTGTPFEQWVTVGRAYMLKLVHMVDEKIHARSIGPRSLVTQQPVKGRARGGGQRLGEMELWALEGFGAAYTLQEMLTIKSDDIKGRETVEHSIIFATTAKSHLPETFRMMLFELRCLCLNIELN